MRPAGGWLLAHLGAALVVTVAFSAILAAELAWAYAPFAPLAPNGQRFTFPSYDVVGVVPIGSMLLGLSLGVVLGALCKRTVIAVVLFVMIFSVFRGGVIFGLRPYLIPPVVATTHITSASSFERAPPGAWTFLIGTRLPNGSIGDAFPFLYAMQACPNLATSDPAGTPRLWACMDSKGYRWATEWQPADRWWSLQLRETAIYAALSIALLLLAWGLATRRE